jgi:hypothetical protein
MERTEPLLAFILVLVGCSNESSIVNSRDGGGGATGADASAESGALDGSDARADAGNDSRVDMSDCGDLGQPCCANQTCGPAGLACASVAPALLIFRCFLCGIKGGPCCEGIQACVPGLECQNTVDSGRRCSDVPMIDASGPCGTCTPVGGQYCGRISDNCGRFLDCPLTCNQPGFTCAGGGLANICGAQRDSGACDPIACQIPGGQLCNLLADTCGSLVDCGTCPNGQICGELAKNVCGRPCPLCPKCGGGVTTTVSGIAVTGARAQPDPLPGALVYVPKLDAGAKLPALAGGPGCRQCEAPDGVIAEAVTGLDGRFTLPNVPAGNGIPLVVQLGRWRRRTTIDVLPCVDNVLGAGVARLPRNQTEGDIPLTAVVTGSHDGIECLLRKMGVDDTEFTNPEGSGRIHLYQSTGAVIDAATPPEIELKGSEPGGGNWSRYSQVLLACEGAELVESPEALENFTAYVNGGGRVLATHFSYTWLFRNGAFESIGSWTPGAADPSDPLATDVVNSTPRGLDFATWLANVGALSRPSPPRIQISAPHADLTALTADAHLWLSSFSPPTTQLASFNVPIVARPDQTCGSVVFSDFHAPSQAPPGATFPAECEPDMALSSQEKALEFMLLNLASCGGPTAPLQPSPLPPQVPSLGPPLPPPPPPPTTSP